MCHPVYEISLISYVAQFHQKVEVLPTQFLQDCTAPEVILGAASRIQEKVDIVRKVSNCI